MDRLAAAKQQVRGVRVIEMMGSKGAAERSSIPLFLEMLETTSPEESAVRQALIRAVAKIDPKNSDVQRAVVNALSDPLCHTAITEVTPQLGASFRSKLKSVAANTSDPNVRAGAIAALGR
jgi:hypothetical protein